MQYKIVYQVASDGSYVGQITLSGATGDISPLDGEWLIPAGCIEVEPPEVSEGQLLFWRDGWVTEDAPAKEPEPEPTPEEIQVAKITALDAEYGAKFAELVHALGLATLDNNTKLIIEIQEEYAELRAEYKRKREELIDGNS